MLDLALFRNPVFSGALAANALSLMGLSGFLYFAAQLLQLVLGLHRWSRRWCSCPDCSPP